MISGRSDYQRNRVRLVQELNLAPGWWVGAPPTTANPNSTAGQYRPTPQTTTATRPEWTVSKSSTQVLTTISTLPHRCGTGPTLHPASTGGIVWFRSLIAVWAWRSPRSHSPTPSTAVQKWRRAQDLRQKHTNLEIHKLQDVSTQGGL